MSGKKIIKITGNINYFVVLTILCPPLGLILGYLSVIRKDIFGYHPKTTAFCFALFLASVAYSYIPVGAPDLVRYFEFVDEVKRHDLLDALQNGIHGESNLQTFATFSWIVGRIGDYHLLPGISVFITYFIGIYVTMSFAKDMKANALSMAATVSVVMLMPNYCSVTNNVRNILAFSLVGLAIFRDCYQKKRNIWTFLLYFLPIFLHPSSILLIALRFAVILPGKIKVLSSIFMLFMVEIVNIVYELSGRISGGSLVGKIIKDFAYKGYAFFNDTNSAWGMAVAKSGSYKLQRYLYISFAALFCVVCIIVVSDIKKREETSKATVKLKKMFGIYICDNKYCQLVDFSFYAGLLTIACLPMLMPEFWRFASATLLFSGPAMLYSMNKLKKVRYYSYSLLCYVPMCMAIWIRDLRLSNIPYLLVNPFFSSPLIIVGKNIAKLF